MAAERVTIHRESFLNGDHELRDHCGARVECNWDVSWVTDHDGKALYWAGMQRGEQVFRGEQCIFVAGQREAPS